MKKVLATIMMGIMSFTLLTGCFAASDNPDTAGKTDEIKGEAQEEKAQEPEEPVKEEIDEDKSVEEESKDNAPDYEKMYAPVFDEISEVLKNGLDHERQCDYISDGLMERIMYPGEKPLPEHFSET